VELEELRDRISWLVRLRWLAVLGVFATIEIAPRLLGVTLAARELYSVTAALAGYNLVAWLLDRFVPAATRGVAVSYFANGQIALDLGFLTALLHYAGGAENPLASYYVFHVAIASLLLSRVAAYLQVTLALGMFAATALLEAAGAIPHYHVKGLFPHELYREPVYLAATLFCVGTTLYLCAFMATSITSRLRRREAEIVRLSAALKDHADELGAAYEELRQLDAQQTEYLHRAAHHLRSPLASLERMMAVVSEGRTGPLSDKSREMLDRARRRVRQMLDLARDLLVLSRARVSSAVAHRDRVDLEKLLRDMAGEFQQQASDGSVALSISYPAVAVEVQADLEAIVELLDNIVSNAIKYTPPGGRVNVSLERRFGQAEIRVSDTGIGIPGEERGRIFEEFYRAPNARNSGKEGTGLGLSIAKAIVESHGGSITIEGREGGPSNGLRPGGTTVRITLPAATTPALA
jgi:signal transduction histidine kinase